MFSPDLLVFIFFNPQILCEVFIIPTEMILKKSCVFRAFLD
ncbi:hypothetical protein X474_01260 [Dethiosulfatarculus sandiegensis]|uniref:Uncharacterized protein n=1 Tax=Dethiosulfatarculus sandiegensis TaxID=1429043 RepID=A0A0D2GN86_9BACT|nr:hypothetical protein X474_01260 [Dethiosulfatarculus sandiegensis]